MPKDLDSIIEICNADGCPPPLQTEIHVPAFTVHSKDALLIQAAAYELGMDIIDFIKLSPYLCARDQIPNGDALRRVLEQLISTYSDREI